MKFLEISKMLNEKNQGKIVLIKSGIFFVATGRSALALESLLPLKRTCISYGICKVGIPVGNIDEYLKELLEMSVPLILYEYYSKMPLDKKQYRKILETEGINKHQVTKDSCDCTSCESLGKFINSISNEKEKLLDKLKNAIDYSNYKEEQITFFLDEDEQK